MDSSTSIPWIGPFPIEGVCDFFFYYNQVLQKFLHFFNANSAYPDPYLGLHCLPMSLSGDIRHKWVNLYVNIFFTLL